MSRVRAFGRHIFKLYEERPLLMNSIAGGSVYITSEVIVQLQMRPKNKTISDSIDTKKVLEIGTLGMIENGVLMLAWYNFLNRYVGSGVTTSIVLFKCLLDQVFFATQQDALFLGLCAFNTEKLPQAIEYVSKTFLTTWILDCSLWPLVNFIGFSTVPLTLQPTYMATVQFFWQLYMSTISATITNNHQITEDEIELARIFDEIDLDKSGYLDKNELAKALSKRGLVVNDGELQAMIEEGDSLEEHDGKISFEEFKVIAKRESNSHLWTTLTTKNMLSKGFRATMTKLNSLNSDSTDTKATDSSKATDQIIDDFDPQVIQHRKDRSDAIKSASISASLLFGCAMIRKLVFKI
jgi:hypothetical protein